MYQYPYGDTQQLNLDWILTKLKELELLTEGNSIEHVANALISATYNAATQYRRYDYCFLNGKLYRCLSDTTGAFNPADWQEVLIGDDIPILTRLINAVDASLTSLQTTVGNQGNAITNLQNAVGTLDSDDVDNASTVTGATVTAALDTLGDAVSDLQKLTEITSPLSTMMDIPTGIVGFRSNTITKNTTGMPESFYDALVTTSQAFYGRIFGGWQTNGNYQGMMIFTAFANTFIGTERIWLITYDVGNHAWYYFNHDKSVTYTEVI